MHRPALARRRSRALAGGRRTLVLAALMLAGCGGSAPAPVTPDVAAVPRLSDCSETTCFSSTLREIVEAAGDPSAAIDGIVEAAYADPQRVLLPRCHGLMHTVGREYALAHRVSLQKLTSLIPRNNDPACAAGFTHGLISGLAQEIKRAGPGSAGKACATAGTRLQRYSCVHGFGHAFMRAYMDDLPPALELCEALGPQQAPDCAQGAYHDHWFAINGADSTTAPAGATDDPRELCGNARRVFVRPCWYRAFIETAGRDYVVGSVEEIDRLCDGLRGLQRQGCVTGAAVLGPPDPRVQLAMCREARASDVASCIRATRVQDMIAHPPRIYPTLIGDCALFRGAGARKHCYRWLGKALGVITDGEFETTGCPLLPDPAGQRQCVAGVREMNDALATFS